MYSLKLWLPIIFALHALTPLQANHLPNADQTLGSPLITLFAHGILDTGAHQIKNYQNIIGKPYAYFNFDDACEPKYGIKLCKFWHCSFGQKNDTARLLRSYNGLVEKFPLSPIVLAGVSRGASVIWSFVAHYHPSNVKALLLESPFDRVQTSLQAAANQVPACINCGITRTLAHWMVQHIAFKYKADELQPLDLADKIPADLPILIICSLEDRLVPAQSSYALYQGLHDHGYQHVYILVLPKGKHAKLLQSSCAQQYEAVVQAFYKKYGLPHDECKAQEGRPLLALCQPTGPLKATIE